MQRRCFVSYGIESDVRFSHFVAVVVRSGGFGQVFFDAVERFEELRYVLLVGFLGAGTRSS